MIEKTPALKVMEDIFKYAAEHGGEFPSVFELSNDEYIKFAKDMGRIHKILDGHLCSLDIGKENILCMGVAVTPTTNMWGDYNAA